MFSEDITATSAAKILRLNRKAINSYYNEFREKILIENNWANPI